MDNTAHIKAAYDRSETLYRWVWGLDQSMNMNYGYWDKNTQTLSQALLNLNHQLGKMVKITNTDHVLDAGCGVGGSSITLAKNIGCKVTGITLSERQVQLAQKNSQRHHVTQLVSFEEGNYLDTRFEDNSFDVVWAIESIFHAAQKANFLREANRILKPQGRLILAEYFLENEPQTQKEKEQLRQWFEGYSIPNLETISSFTSLLTQTDFTNYSFQNISSNILPSSKKLYQWGKLGKAFFPLFPVLKPILPANKENILGTIAQYETLKKELWQYYIVYAEKK